MNKLDAGGKEKMDKMDNKLEKLQSSLDYSLPIIGLTATGLGTIVKRISRSLSTKWFLCLLLSII